MNIEHSILDIPSGGRGNRSRSGSALIVALWVVILLSIIVGSFAFDMHVEARITSYYRKRLKADYLARAGIEKTKLLLARSADKDIKEDTYEHQDAPWYSDAKRLARGEAVHGMTDELETGTVSVDIVPEEGGRRNVNALNEDDWRGILKAGNVPEEMWDELIDCFFDWKDPDGVPRPYGAETEDYYATLDPPYRAKNDGIGISTIGELLLIKGFDTAIVYGGLPEGADEEDEPMTGIEDLLTTFGDRKVNVNTASERVLMTLPEIEYDTVMNIIDEREGSWADENSEEDFSFNDQQNLCSRVTGLSASQIGSIRYDKSRILRITSTGRSHGVARRISCIVWVEDAKTGKMTVWQWTESEGE